MEVLECPFEIAPLFNVVLEDLQMTRLAGWLPKSPQAMWFGVQARGWHPWNLGHSILDPNSSLTREELGSGGCHLNAKALFSNCKLVYPWLLYTFYIYIIIYYFYILFYIYINYIYMYQWLLYICFLTVWLIWFSTQIQLNQGAAITEHPNF